MGVVRAHRQVTERSEARQRQAAHVLLALQRPRETSRRIVVEIAALEPRA
jgi:hypothetical protein